MDADEPASLPPEPPPRRPTAFLRQFAMAMELPFMFAGAIFLGGLLGYWLDRWIGTKPWMMIAFGALGLYAGLRELLRRLVEDKPDGHHEPKS